MAHSEMESNRHAPDRRREGSAGNPPVVKPVQGEQVTSCSLIARGTCRYTGGMKTAVSIPDDVFEGAERLARRTKKSRSQLFSDALREYVARHAPEEVTDAMNRVCAVLSNAKD